jgi:hypothetical protein
MPDYPFDMQLVVDPLNPFNVVPDASVTIFDPADEAETTPLDLKDPQGFPLPNPILSNHLAFTSPFTAELPQVKWRSGAYTGYFASYTGLRDEAVAAAESADDAAAASEASAQAAIDAANGFTVGTVTEGSPAAASFTGTAPNRQLHLTLPPGPAGADGAPGHNPITVSATAPSSPVDGDIWFDIS